MSLRGILNVEGASYHHATLRSNESTSKIDEKQPSVLSCTGKKFCRINQIYGEIWIN